ncbi:2OG-Fe(II) oxygenase family protein [uncultured Polaribacter sp.]|uniref:2OG-Fe(II) oxygenase family protein n=1 Tax=uncultured Polaribacter sp. TaxID=174711 RepID=UPI00262367D4|nr:2OG-Fe(II) oxygenase family protein [uncultured Polaribacter sp.]
MIKTFDLISNSDVTIRKALASFVQKDRVYKNNYLQANYKKAFDGYSFIGQKDSLNQYDTDMLHSFVLSDFQEVEHFPKEFHPFLKNEWKPLIKRIKALELASIKKLNNSILEQLYKDDVIGYMMSCNYYPKPLKYSAFAKNNTRLSAHKDVSLFTTFPFGIANGLSFFNEEKNRVAVGEKNTIIQFSGYFLEFVSQHKIKALEHQVNLPKDLNTERYSFAIFSIPKPNISFWLGNKKIESNNYYKKYLSLF